MDSLKNNKHWTLGIDEVGYGCWAGPVVVCAVALPAESPPVFSDSKQLSAIKRGQLFEYLLNLWRGDRAKISISFGSVRQINDTNILYATHRSMESAYDKISPEYKKTCFIDGRLVPKKLFNKALPCIKGDQQHQAISAASIFAKVYRDHYMDCLSLFYPEYKWAQNKGYGTKAHKDAIHRCGATKEHRLKYKVFS